MSATTPTNGTRTPEQIREHYEVEKELAARLRNANRRERRELYTSLYDELFRRVPHHPQLLQKKDASSESRKLANQMGLLKRFLRPEVAFLEVGPGDCALSIEASKHAKEVHAVDVSNEITGGRTFPANFELHISDGCSIPLPENSMDVAYSNQLMEHLHPDDTLEQLRNIYKALKPGGVYICITPNALAGPHDISRYFDRTPTGFHLKEYTYSQLAPLFRSVGFRRISAYVGAGGRYIKTPIWVMSAVEALLMIMPWKLRRKVTHLPCVPSLLEPRIAARK